MDALTFHMSAASIELLQQLSHPPNGARLDAIG
jgi:hypothetical protein